MLMYRVMHPTTTIAPPTRRHPPQTSQEEIQAEIAALQDIKAARAKRDRKKERERLARLRVRQAYGMRHDVRFLGFLFWGGACIALRGVSHGSHVCFISSIIS